MALLGAALGIDPEKRALLNTLLQNTAARAAGPGRFAQPGIAPAPPPVPQQGPPVAAGPGRFAQPGIAPAPPVPQQAPPVPQQAPPMAQQAPPMSPMQILNLAGAFGDAPGAGLPPTDTEVSSAPGVVSGGAATAPGASLGQYLSTLGRGVKQAGILGGIGDAMQVDDRLAQQNRTTQFLQRLVGDPQAAEMIAQDPVLRRQVMSSLIATKGGGKPVKLEVTDIFDDQGRKQKVLLNPISGETRPLGGPQAAGPSKLSEAQKSLDRQFGKDYAEFTTRGGFADAEKNIQQLRIVLNELKSGENITGTLQGLVTESDTLGSMFAPKSLDRRQLVEEVVQRNLRLILGAQFTQREGDRLIARAYNPYLDEKPNAARLERLTESMNKALKAKRTAAKYFENNGTMVGYKGPSQRELEDDALSSVGLKRSPEDDSTAPAAPTGQSKAADILKKYGISR